jgi:hypothetical protein
MPLKELTTQKHYHLTPREKKSKAIHIFIDTNFKIENRRGTPIFVLNILSEKRYIRKLEHLIDMSFQEQKSEVSKIICAHYAENEGEIAPWGNIKQYHYRFMADCPAIVFDTTGNVIGESNFTEGKPSISIRGKKIPHELLISAS